VTLPAIFLVGWFCVNGACLTFTEKTKSLEDCKAMGNDLKLILDEQNIRKYFFACVNASDEYI